MTKIDWIFTQNNSDKILADGLFKLKTKPHQSFSEIDYKGFGNYLISHKETNYYVGEGKDLCKRIKQQFKPKTSTFYKTLIKLEETDASIKNIPIDSFKVQIIKTEIGRKEIEEFGISNFQTILNKFQLNKRKAYDINQNGLWDKVQESKNEILLQAEEEILNGKFNPWFDCSMEKVAGLYIVRDKHNKLLYIGESSNICDRFNTHSKTTYFSALRRHIGTEVLNYELHERNGRKKYFKIDEDENVTEFLKSCQATFYPTHFGRYELEEFLIRKHRPLLNRKGNKRIEEAHAGNIV